MKKMELDAALDRFLKEEDAEEYFWPDQMAGNRTIFDYSDIVGKEISFTPEENMSADWFWSKAHVQPAPANNQYDIDFRGICDFVFAHVERELFTTLDAIFFVFNEEGLDEATMENAMRAIAAADTLIVGGTSLAVYPAAGLLRYFRGDTLVVINKQPTPADSMASLVLNLPIGQALAEDNTP